VSPDLQSEPRSWVESLVAYGRRDPLESLAEDRLPWLLERLPSKEILEHDKNVYKVLCGFVV
jgi:hypothetical protein